MIDSDAFAAIYSNFEVPEAFITPLSYEVSYEELATAVASLNAEEIILLPNNKNAVSTCELFAKRSTKKIMVPSEYQSYLTTPGQYTVSILFRGQETSIVVNIVSIYTVSFSAYKENTPTLVVVAKKSVLDGDGATAPSEFSTNFIAARLHYRFTSWDADFSAVTADLAVTAVYSTIAVYQVNFYDGNLKAISTQWIDKGADAVEPTETERAVAGYVFVGWDRSYKAVIKDLEIYGIYYKVTVK